MKKIVAFLALILLFSVNGFAYNVGVYDDADLLTAVEEEKIIGEADTFADKTGFSLAVVTTSYASGLSSEEYADDFLDNLIDTKGWQENSFLILIDMDNRNVWISTTGDCQLAFSDSEIQTVIDGGYNELTIGFYSDAVLGMIRSASNMNTDINPDSDYYITDDEWYFGEEEFEDNVIQFEDDYYQFGDDGEWVQIDDYYGYQSDSDGISFSDFLVYLVIGLVIGVISALVVKSRYKNMGKGDEFNANDISLKLTSSNDNIISRNVVTAKIPRNNNRTGGSARVGGSSVHRSSGGRSHDGGGRRF